MNGDGLLAERLARVGQAASRQRLAVAPDASAWVAASAGTGKTRVLTDRVLSLLLAGVSPQRILCLTFTKAAAAEMSIRLARTLRFWATARDPHLEDELFKLLGTTPEGEVVERARRLFARVLDVPGGLQIRTIHAFCQSLLARFPLEAGVAPHFGLLDERSAAERLLSAQEQVLARAGMAGHEALSAAVEAVTAQVNEQDFAALLGELVRERARLAALFRDGAGVDDLLTRLAARLRIDPDEDEAEVVRAACSDRAIDHQGLRKAARALQAGSKSDRRRGEQLAGWLEAGEDRSARWVEYEQIFLTTAGERRKTLAYKDAVAAWPEVEQVMDTEAGRLAEVRERLQAIACFRATAGLLRLGAAILDVYESGKRAEALLDYDDLILTSCALLRRPGIAPWVLYKLDGGLEHLLIDEAQDTNPEQWEVIRLITEEFFAGEGAHEDLRPPLARSVFAVGDAKQSIYSFQHADPALFGAMRRYFAARVRSAKRPWRAVDLTHSFRSSAAVLRLVDAVFAPEEVQDGVTFGDPWLAHEPIRVGQAGRVELWPVADAHEESEGEAWEPPVSRSGGLPARARLARQVARRIASWVHAHDVSPGDEAWLDSKARRIRPGDVLILVRRRNAFVEEVVRELRNRAVPVAGVDRMVLGDQLAVMDLVALGRVLLLPDDDLTLATVLKGPLIGLTEEQLFDLAWDRGQQSLWTRLRTRAAGDPGYSAAYSRLSALMARADYLPPFELFADLLADGGRRSLLARLGPEAADAIEEFLSLALVYERDQVPSLEGFLHWLELGRQEVKRDLESGGDMVRVMTVHGAKGLQAPIVFLPDSMQVPRQTDRLLWLPDEAEKEAAIPLWVPRRSLEERVAATARAAARSEQDREYRRLLYVALTRAEDRLYICGWQTRQSPPETCWYQLVERAMSGDLAKRVAFDFVGEGDEGWQGYGWSLQEPQEAGPERPSSEEPAGFLEPLPGLPDWARQDPPAELRPPRPLAPSRPPGLEPAIRSPLGEDAGQRFRRGRLLHRLLEALPEVPVEKRRAAARDYLAQPSHGLDEATQSVLADETMAVLEAPDLSVYFGPGSRGEVPVIGLIDGRHGPEVVSGQVDRLCVLEEEVLVLDFKTNRPVPSTATETPPAYLRQMAAYRAVLGAVYPDRAVRCALLWTDQLRLMTLPDDLLDAHAP